MLLNLDHHFTNTKKEAGIIQYIYIYMNVDVQLCLDACSLVSLVWLVRFLDETLPCSWSAATVWTPLMCLVASLCRWRRAASSVHAWGGSWAAWMNQHLSVCWCESLPGDAGLQTPDEWKLLLQDSRVKYFTLLSWMGKYEQRGNAGAIQTSYTTLSWNVLNWWNIHTSKTSCKNEFRHKSSWS